MDALFLSQFQRTVTEAEQRLRAISDAESSIPRMQGKWSPREIIGHLIDSASNNHHRFVRAQFKDDLMFDGYEQDQWVAAQQYQKEEWQQLITLWSSFNRHILHLIEHIPDPVLKKEHRRHNLHERAFIPVAQDQPATLEYFIIDYFQHLKHHLRQIFHNHSGFLS